MADLATVVDVMPAGKSLLDRKVKKSSGRKGIVSFLLALAGGLAYIAFHVARDLDNVTITSVWPYVLLALALLIALGFEFVNGFHDTANAVATVIYTHSLEPNVAVVLSGICQSGGRAFFFRHGGVCGDYAAAGGTDSSGQLRRGICHGLCAADRGHPVESGHLVVWAAGFEFAHHGGFDHRRGPGQPAFDLCTAAPRDVDWEQAIKVLKVLLISPLLGLYAGRGSDPDFEAASQVSRRSMKRRKTTSRRRGPFAR